MPQININDVREHLMQTLQSLRDKDRPMDIDRARAVAQVASVLVDTAKVEVDYLRATGQERSAFLSSDAAAASSGYTQGDVTRLNGVTVHRIKG